MNAPITGPLVPADLPELGMSDSDGRVVRNAVPMGMNDENDGIDLRKLWALARRNAVIVIATVLIALLAGLAATVLTTPQFRATASVQIEQQAERVLETQDREPAAQSLDVERFLQTQTDIIRSRATAISVAQSLRLFGNERFYEATGTRGDTGGQGAITQRVNRERALDVLLDRLEVVLPRNSRIVDISFRSADPKLSADIANAFATTLITGNLQRRYNSSSYARDFLARQLVEAKAKLEQSERDLNQYARQAGLIATRSAGTGDEGRTTGRESVTTSSLVQLNEAYNAAKAARIAAEQKWRTAQATPAAGLSEVLSNPAASVLLQQRAEKSVALQEERARHRDDYPAVRELVSQVAELDRQIASLSASIRGSIRDQYQVAANQERSLAEQVGGLKEETLSEQDRSVRFNILSREVDTNRTLYDGLLQRFKEVSAASGVSTNNISIIDTAEAPLEPSSPRLAVNLALALLVGLVLAAALVYLREELDDAVRSPADIERKLRLPVLGIIPRVASVDNVIELLREPKSPVSEAYAALRTSLIYVTPHGVPRTLLITSSQPAEGKSTSSVAIASALANLGKRVVLIDADLRRPSLHRVVGVPNAVGLSDLLVGEHGIAESIQPAPGLAFRIIPSGPIPPNPTDLLSTPRLAAVLEALEAQFDVVVIDGPPVLGLADAPLLSAQAEATVLIVESNRGFRGRTKGAIRRLNTAHANLLGAVLTKFEAHKSGVGYEYGYEYYYSYGGTGSGSGGNSGGVTKPAA